DRSRASAPRDAPGSMRRHEGWLERGRGPAGRRRRGTRGPRPVMQVAEGMVVVLEYTVHLADGTLLDSTGEGGPLTGMVGSGQRCRALEDRIAGRQPGETRERSIPAADAYGEWRQELVRQMPRDRLPPDLVLEVGHDYRLKSPDGKVLRFRLLRVEGDVIEADFNRPGAGQDLRAIVTVVGVRAPTPEEERRGGGGAAAPRPRAAA